MNTDWIRIQSVFVRVTVFSVLCLYHRPELVGPGPDDQASVVSAAVERVALPALVAAGHAAPVVVAVAALPVAVVAVCVVALVEPRVALVGSVQEQIPDAFVA